MVQNKAREVIKDHVQQAEIETLKRQMQTEKERLEHEIIQLKSARTIDEDKVVRSTYRLSSDFPHGACIYLSIFASCTLFLPRLVKLL